MSDTADALTARRSGEELLEKMQASTDWSGNGPFKRAIKVFDDALRLYGPDDIVLSFNGGKDATILLHLARAAVAGFLKTNKIEDGPTCLRCVYFVENNGFQEMEDFIVEMEKKYHLRIERFPGGFKDGCEHMIKKFEAKAFILGTRKSDPHGKFVEAFSPSSAGWPPFMRVHPILSWEYDDVWRFLIEMSLEYCCLYDRGFTSIGRKDNTEKNPLLLQPDGTYLPAHKLKLQAMDPLLERHGRVPSAGGNCDGDLCSAGIVTIGNEVLSAKVQDVNTNYASRVLRSCGVVLRRVAVLPDQTEEIAKAVREMAADCTAVITIGGIGPTHDDVTFRAVAEGLGRELAHSVEMEGFLRQFKRRPSQEGAGLECPDRASGLNWDTQKMCRMPQGTELLMEEGKDFPLLRCASVSSPPPTPPTPPCPSPPPTPHPPTPHRVPAPPHPPTPYRVPAPPTPPPLCVPAPPYPTPTPRLQPSTQSLEMRLLLPRRSSVTAGVAHRLAARTLTPQPCTRFMLPGVPQFMRQQIDHAGRLLKKSGCAFHCRQLRFSVEEALLAKAITETAEQFANVEVGSYPYYNGAPYKTIVMIEARCNNKVEACQQFMTAQVPASYIISVDSDPTLPPA